MLGNSTVKAIVLFLVCTGLLIFLHEYRPPSNDSLWNAILNTGHIPLFGILSLLCLGLSSIVFKNRMRKRLYHYIIAFTAASTAGLVSELLQIAGPRDADVGDFLRDLAGIILFLGFYATFDKRLEVWREKLNSIVYKVAFRITAAVLFLVLISPPVMWETAYMERDSKFPVLCDFGSVWSRMFLRTQDAEMEIVSAPPEIASTKNDKAAMLTFKPAEYPALRIREPYPDWRGYDYLEFRVFSDLDSQVNLVLVITDIHHNNEYNDRFTGVFPIRPGPNLIQVPFERIRNAPTERKLDMANIASVLVFMYQTDREYVLYISDFQLK
jgi:hypothetical protein